MRSAQYLKTSLTALIVLTTLAVAACDSRSSASMNPVGPSPMAGQVGSGGTIGNMHGGGMGAQVESEFDYLVQMIPHHEEAIAAATVLERDTQRQEMRSFAVSIIETQTAEVEQMRAWLAVWYPGRDRRVSYEPMMRELTGLAGNALDRAFLDDMIPHHMMAVMMSQQFVSARLANHPEVIPFATNIRDTQRAEIHTMAAWLRDWFGATPSMGMGE